ncbi:unnamed protein product [Mytilus coruscus]|uniref:DUF6589 domain-containing protein n=1 Tax=Mytilus coruscus TaxID=42192 RepID=A0A6J8DWQ4_MYTCO|nr:unnamed protein product [Mytilus coruscus]
MIKESIDLVNGDADTMVQRIREFSNAENDLHQYRDLTHPGFYFVGDNVDMRTKVRNMTIYNQQKDHHMYQICAYENRISGNHLDNTVAKGDANTVPSLLSYRINMGVLMKREQYSEDMPDICEFMHKYVPGHNETDDWTKQPEKVLSGGDYLTFERHKQAQSSKRNGRTPTKRLEGLVPKMEEFHNQGELLKLLYSTSLARDQGTLYAARNTINARNVTQDPDDDFYAASNLVEKVTTAYIITGGLTHFGMGSIDSVPCKHVYDGEVWNTNDMKEYIRDQARSFVKTFTLSEVPKLPEYGPNCNTCNCRTVNHRGDVNTNHPNDLDVEHCNKVFKDSAHSNRGVFTEKVVARVSKSAMKVHEIIKQFDKVCNVQVPSGRHKTCDKEIDIITLVKPFQACNLFDFIPGRSHCAYPNIKENPLTELDMEFVRDWIAASLKKFQNNISISRTILLFQNISSSEL